MSEDDTGASPASTPSPFTAPFDWYVETARTTLERSLETQQAAVDGWASALTPQSDEQPAAATPIQGTVWLYDIWSESLRNALVHLDDAIDEEGIDLDSLQMIWLHAMDDAITDVGKRPPFGAAMADAVERTLNAQAESNERRRETLRSAGLPTDRDMEAVGERLLDLEYRQKSLADKLDAVLAAVGAESAPERGPAVEAPLAGDSS